MIRKHLAGALLCALAFAAACVSSPAAAQVGDVRALPGAIPNAGNAAACPQVDITAGGAFVPTCAHQLIGANTGTSDDLTDITATAFAPLAAGMATVAAGDTITVRTTGNISTPDGADIVLSAGDVLYWMRDEAGTGVNVAAPDKVAYSAALASTASGKGAALIGVEDAAGNYTATTVEGALAEVYSDFGSTANGLGASLIGVEDSGGNFTATTVEGILAEIGSGVDVAGDIRNYGAALDGVTDDSTAWTNAISALNGGTIKYIFHPGGTSIYNPGTIPTITCDSCSIIGVGKASTIKKPAAATSGAFFKFGRTIAHGDGIDDASVGFVMQNINLEIDSGATVGANDPAFEFIWINNDRFENIWFDQIATLMKFTKGGDSTFRNWFGSMQKGGSADANIDFYDVASNWFVDWSIDSGNATSNGNANGAIFRFNTTPATGGSIDTMRFINVSAQMFNSLVGGSGKPYGILFNRVNTPGNSSITNIMWLDSFVDHTTTAAFYDVTGANTGSLSDSRWIYFEGYRFCTDAGHGFVIDHSTTAPQDRSDFMIGNGKVCIQDNSQAVLITGSKPFRNSFVNGLNVTNRNAVAKTKAISVNAEGWRISNINIDEDGSGADPTKFATGVVIESASLTNTFVADTVYCGVFGCTTAISAASSQRIGQNWGDVVDKTISGGSISVSPNDKYIRLSAETGTSDTLDTITGGKQGQELLVTVTSGHEITITNNFGTNGIWSGANNVLGQAVDNMQLFLTGTKWQAIAKSFNLRDRIVAGEAANITIASGIATISSGSYVILDTEASAATDDFDCISSAKLPVSSIVVFRQVNSSRDITVRPSQTCAGNELIRLNGNVNYAWSNATDTLTLLKISGTEWVEIGRSDNF